MAIYPIYQVIDHLLQPEMTHATIYCELEDKMTAHTETTARARIESGAFALQRSVWPARARATAAVTA